MCIRHLYTWHFWRLQPFWHSCGLHGQSPCLWWLCVCDDGRMIVIILYVWSIEYSTEFYDELCHILVFERIKCGYINFSRFAFRMLCISLLSFMSSFPWNCLSFYRIAVFETVAYFIVENIFTMFFFVMLVLCNVSFYRSGYLFLIFFVKGCFLQCVYKCRLYLTFFDNCNQFHIHFFECHIFVTFDFFWIRLPFYRSAAASTFRDSCVI